MRDDLAGWIALMPQQPTVHRPRGRQMVQRGAGVLFAVGATLLMGCANQLTEAGPVIGSGRIERPEDGFTVTFPARWEVREWLPEQGPGRWGRPMGSLGGRLALFAGAPSGNGGCYVHVNDRFAEQPISVDTYADRSIEDLRSDSGLDIEKVRRAVTDLPAEWGKRIDVTFSGGGATEYMLTQDGVFYTLGCFVPSGDPPADRWLSIAETFEFLPAVE
jgi:hypothetical protein